MKSCYAVTRLSGETCQNGFLCGIYLVKKILLKFIEAQFNLKMVFDLML